MKTFYGFEEEEIDVEKKIEEQDNDMLDAIDNSAIDGQVELSVEPTKPEVEPSDDEMTSEEKKDETTFEKEMDEIIEEARPELDATIDPTTQLSENSERAVEPCGYNPEEEEGESKLVKEIVDMATPVNAEVVQDEILNVSDDILSAEPEDYTFNQNEVLIERDDDKVEDITDKVDNIEAINSVGQIEDGELKTKTEDGEKISTFAANESDSEDLEEIVGEIIEDQHEDSDNVMAPEEIDIEEPEKSYSDSDDINPNAQIGELSINEIHVLTEDGMTSEEVDVTVPAVAETPLDDVETGEVIHLNTIDEADIEAKIEAEVKEQMGTESEDTDLNLGIVDGHTITDKDQDHEVIVGDVAEVAMAVTAEANKNVDGDQLEEYEVTSGPDSNDANVEIDETKEIEDREGSPIIEESRDEDNFAEAFEPFINDPLGLDECDLAEEYTAEDYDRDHD